MRKEMILIIYRLFLISSNKRSNFMFNIDDNQESYNRR